MKNQHKEASSKLTPEQIANWRNMLRGIVGSYAMLMPDEEVQQMRDNMQAKFCDPEVQKAILKEVRDE